MLNQHICNIHGSQAGYDQYRGLVVDRKERERIAETLGTAMGCNSINHGLLTVGTTADEAAHLFHLIRRAHGILLAEAAAANSLEQKIILGGEAQGNFKMTSEAVKCKIKSHSNFLFLQISWYNNL